MASRPGGTWQDRRIIVAGGTAGFGLVLARHLLDAGGRVLLVGRSADGVRQALDACDRDGIDDVSRRLRGIAADLAVGGEGGRVVGEALRFWGGVDALFFCVGRSGRRRILATSPDELRGFFDANVTPAVEITAAVADEIAASRGHLVYIGSLAGKLVTPFMGPYCVAKSALAAYVEAVRLEMSPRGGHVLLVSPGPIGRHAADPRAGEANDRYRDDRVADDLPPEAASPGGTRAITPLDPDRLAERVLEACRRRRGELVVPRKAALLAGLIEWCPDWGRRLLGRIVSHGP